MLLLKQAVENEAEPRHVSCGDTAQWLVGLIRRLESTTLLMWSVISAQAIHYHALGRNPGTVKSTEMHKIWVPESRRMLRQPNAAHERAVTGIRRI